MKNRAPRNFCGLDGPYTDYDRARVVILPVPYDRTSTWVRGSRRGPRALIDASRNLELYDIETGSLVYRQGIHTSRPVRARKPEYMVARVHDRVERFLEDGKFTVVLGGEHSVAIGAVRAHAERFPGMSVLHLDAHSDRREVYEGSRYNHACVMARVEEIVEKAVSVGIRSMDESELALVDESKMLYAHRFVGGDGSPEQLLSLLDDPVYITLDLDVLDPGIMPSTGTPEPGGLHWYELIELLRSVIDARRVVGFDVVELCPSPVNRAADFLAAKLVYMLLSYLFGRGTMA
jgi:agmatinase